MTVTSGHGEHVEQRGTGAPAERERLVVVGVDGTPAGVAALAWAADQARTSGGRLLAIAVSEPPPLMTGGAEMAGGVVVPPLVDDEELAAAAEAWLTDAITALPVTTGKTVERQVARGDAATVLLEAAAGADMLVLGNHGRGAIAGALSGSVAQHCVHHATCPLVLVPAPGS